MTDDRGWTAATLEDDLTAWGKVITLETRGRRSGQAQRVSVGFLEEPGGDLLVAAADEASHWARNLIAEPRCRIQHAGSWSDRLATRLAGSARHATVSGLILKYGTPAERLGNGPAFRLRLDTAAADADPAPRQGHRP